jgi:hypothetical protein
MLHCKTCDAFVGKWLARRWVRPYLFSVNRGAMWTTGTMPRAPVSVALQSVHLTVVPAS